MTDGTGAGVPGGARGQPGIQDVAGLPQGQLVRRKGGSDAPRSTFPPVSWAASKRASSSLLPASLLHTPPHPAMLALLLPQDLYGGDVFAAAAAAAGLHPVDALPFSTQGDESLPYSTSELNAPEYSTDDFRMFQFKVTTEQQLACRCLPPPPSAV